MGTKTVLIKVQYNDNFEHYFVDSFSYKAQLLESLCWILAKKSKNNEAEKNVSMEQTRERVMRTGKVVWRGHTFQEHLHHRIPSNISVNTY